ncbi:MAG: hypothetical protein COV36_01190 [Alphaproteobacteria bacterium CG11_big_fil_rev_8_21_14_0_20_44_7]|nr:MAG: hypothetical protein COV36_01190 [Alphaproteobacteria bacterium CG11_big_fil_rev_8_21_14_0_20_44_7]
MEKIVIERSVVFVSSEEVGKYADEEIAIKIGLVTRNKEKVDREPILSDLIRYKPLIKAGIIDDSWEEQTFPEYTDGFAKISYENGISFDSVPDKLTVRDTKPIDNDDFYNRVIKLYELIKKEGIKVYSFGMNFLVCREADSATNDFASLYLTDILDNIDGDIVRDSLRVSYDLDNNKILNLKIFTNKAKNIKNVELSKEECILVDANFHHSLQDSDLDFKIEIKKAEEKLNLIKSVS